MSGCVARRAFNTLVGRRQRRPRRETTHSTSLYSATRQLYELVDKLYRLGPEQTKLEKESLLCVASTISKSSYTVLAGSIMKPRAPHTNVSSERREGIGKADFRDGHMAP